MRVKNLSEVSFETLVDCFLETFDNYYVQMPVDRAYYRKRWKAAKVDFKCSYGMFDGDLLVGFIIHAIDQRQGKCTAFNTGTGVLPKYRGQGIVKSIYNYAFNDLAEKGIEKSTLEVISINDRAISLYKAIGFKVCKTYRCFNGTIALDFSSPYELREIELANVDWSRLPNQQCYSWDNQKESIVRGSYRFFEVIYNEKPESFFIINPDLNYLAQFDIFMENTLGWNRLFGAIQEISPTIRINNIDERLKDKVNQVISFGLKNTVDQFEMELNIEEGKTA
ncbi:MAG: GNAT family N-acetyltransferase [Robiginitalea sp.]|uniref:GNAT family N-acetyltransferase n=1 Tax=Robiginitalea sp. TaxID=1902411 RepID=UPI003C77549F